MKTTVTQSVSTGRDLTLQDATIQGNAYIGGQVTLNKAVIGNTLSLASHRLVLTGSNVNNIKMYLPQRHSFSNAGPLIASNTVMTGQGIVIGGNVIGASNGSFVNVGPQSVSSVNGFTIKGSPDQTTIITPENTIYVNGTNVSGNGPKHYEDYKATHPNAPSVSGPGWTSSNQTPMLQETQDTVQQIVELTENSLIQGKLYFESGRGKVVVHPGSRFTGSVEGGTIERL
jgi:hypothetical protein